MVIGMAKKTTTLVELIDDVDGGKADRTVAFSFGGAQYEIDLSKKNATAMTKALKPYIEAARKVRAPRGRGPNATKSVKRNDLADVRAWAAKNGHTVSDRGRIPTAVLEAYDTAK